MTTRRMLAAALAVTLVVGATPLLAQQASGVLAGKATNEAKKPYTDYTVQLRDAATGQVVGTVPLDAQGQFTFNSLEQARRYLVELFSKRTSTVVCTEGPFVLSPSMMSKTDVKIDCGKPPAALWLLAAGAGTAAAIAIATRSASQ
jgi:hypothetical protein